MSTRGKRPRVRLHGGGISPGQVRRRKRVASEKATAPLRDIRDIGPGQGTGNVLKPCRICGRPVVKRRAARCDGCLADDWLVKDVRRKLAELDGMEVPGSWAGTSLASCRGLPARG